MNESPRGNAPDRCSPLRLDRQGQCEYYAGLDKPRGDAISLRLKRTVYFRNIDVRMGQKYSKFDATKGI